MLLICEYDITKKKYNTYINKCKLIINVLAYANASHMRYYSQIICSKLFEHVSFHTEKQ